MDIDFPEEEAVPEVQIAVRDMEAEKIRLLETDLYRQVSEILADSMHWADIEPGTERPPKAWIVELGLEGAERRFRLAKAAWMNAKEAPVGLKLAKDAQVGMAKARATENQGPRILNATLVQTTAPIPTFPERIVLR